MKLQKSATSHSQRATISTFFQYCTISTYYDRSIDTDLHSKPTYSKIICILNHYQSALLFFKKTKLSTENV